MCSYIGRRQILVEELCLQKSNYAEVYTVIISHRLHVVLHQFC